MFPIIKQFLKVLSLPVMKGNIRIQYFITVKVSDHCFIPELELLLLEKYQSFYIFLIFFQELQERGKKWSKNKSHMHTHRNTPQFRSPHNPLEE